MTTSPSAVAAPPAAAALQGPIGLVGLGLIGGSLGLDLQRCGHQVRALVHRASTAERARQRGLAQVVDTDAAVLAGCRLVVLALPLDRLLDPSPALVAALPAEAVVTDVGSVKGPVLRRWRGLHPRFVASHPMAGSAEAGVEAGRADLFRGRPWVATPEAGGDGRDLAAVQALAVAVGARWLTCDAAAHDRAVALISHLPVLTSAALLLAAEQGAAGSPQEWDLHRLTRALASSGFADTTRVGGGNPELGVLMARWNREALAEALTGYRHCLEQLEQRLAAADWEGLEGELRHCRDLRPEFL